MKYARVTISIPEALLAEIDAEAEGAGLSRSAVVQEASAQYVTRRHESAAAEERRRSVELAVEGFRRARQHPLVDPRPTIELLRELREGDDFAPER